MTCSNKGVSSSGMERRMCVLDINAPPQNALQILNVGIQRIDVRWAYSKFDAPGMLNEIQVKKKEFDLTEMSKPMYSGNV